MVDITANHQGHFEFKLCPNDNIFLDPEQDCFDHFPLSTSDASKHYPINDRELGFRLLYVQLPLRVTCQQCILQWTYVGGNNWGDCADGTSGLGCGPQENFRSCADVRIVPHPLLADLVKPTHDHRIGVQPEVIVSLGHHARRADVFIPLDHR